MKWKDGGWIEGVGWLDKSAEMWASVLVSSIMGSRGGGGAVEGHDLVVIFDIFVVIVAVKACWQRRWLVGVRYWADERETSAWRGWIVAAVCKFPEYGRSQTLWATRSWGHGHRWERALFVIRGSSGRCCIWICVDVTLTCCDD